MSHLTLSEAARRDLGRLHHFLAQFDLNVASDGIDAIMGGLTYIETHPLAGEPVPDRVNVRKMVVDFGASGYLIFHKRYERQDMNVALRIIHQREWYEAEHIGLVEEASLASTDGLSITSVIKVRHT